LTEPNTGGQPSITYEYNAIGNITSRQVGSNTFSYTYHATKKHAVSNINLNGSNYAFSYDNDGNMTSGYDLTDPANVASRTIAWNADNLPSRIQYTKGGSTATVDFFYDGEGEDLLILHGENQVDFLFSFLYCFANNSSRCFHL
jgi:hypothetical protein